MESICSTWKYRQKATKLANLLYSQNAQEKIAPLKWHPCSTAVVLN